ncbi:hypothetical protein GE09DRAFT_376730 [Coniochaeta sp. 2T2.1]|nr:hypothetical protein GE09DRAFT_376730 [Coniochaeta sp. 2T2.1]
MGSSTTPQHPVSDSLILTTATPQEREKIWSLHHEQWGGALTHEAYLERESYLRNAPLQRLGGITHWLLTTSTSSSSSSPRPILSSCDTYRKRAVSCTPDGTLKEGIAHGIGAVFTDPQYRGKGYASRMLKELGEVLKTWQTEKEGGEALFSVLYSDIGKTFYAKSGWEAFPSGHMAFPPAGEGEEKETNGEVVQGKDKAHPIGYHEPAELCAADEELLRKKLPLRARETGRTAVALLPDLDSVLWHLMREDFIAKNVFGKTPAVKGAVYGEKGKRVWGVWTRAYYGEVGTLHFLRFVLEDEDGDEEENARGVREVVRVAQREAREWKCKEVQSWNPGEKLRAAVRRAGLEVSFVERDAESIASLMWYGEGRTLDVDWVYNEKFGWC